MLVTRRTALTLTSSVALAPLIGCGETTTPAPAPDASSDQAFAQLGQRWLDETCRTSPSFATSLGNHAFDGDLNDVSAAGRAARAAVRDETRTALAAIDPATLSREAQVDANMLAERLDSGDFTANDLQSWAWDPLEYADLAGGSLYSLMARDFALLPERLASAAARMEKLPDLLAQTREALQVERVPPIHATTYSFQNAGAASIIDNLILAQATDLDGEARTRLAAAAETAKTALAEHQAWIDDTLVPSAQGDFRIGPALYDAKLRFSLDEDIDRETVATRARADLERVQAEMLDISRGILGANMVPAAPNAAQRRDAIAAALDIAANDHAARDDVFRDARATLEDATQFVREHDLITMPDAPVQIIEMPEFQQGVAVAYCDSPGPLDKHLDTFYAISPIPASWTDEQTESFLREYNNRSMYELTIHEAVPGHYVQIWHSNQHPSTLRAVLGSGTFIEGWACYAQDVMIEAGHGGDDPLRRLVNLKWALRVITNAILDQGVHVEGWSEEATMRFMLDEAFQEEREAAGKWTRAQLSSTQLATYYVGWQAHHDLRREVQTAQGAGFDLKAYHDRVLSFGSPPVRLARALMLDLPIA